MFFQDACSKSRVISVGLTHMKDVLCFGEHGCLNREIPSRGLSAPALPGSTREIPVVREIKTIAAKIPQPIFTGLLGIIYVGSYF